jgi:hypothetical protein
VKLNGQFALFQGSMHMAMAGFAELGDALI